MDNASAGTNPGSGPEAEPPLLRDVYPDLSTELIELLTAEGESDLSTRANDLRIIAPCGCADDFCQSIYTAPRPNGAYGPGHRNVSLSPTHGMIVLDVVHDRIMYVEVLYHPPLVDRTADTGSADAGDPV